MPRAAKAAHQPDDAPLLNLTKGEYHTHTVQVISWPQHIGDLILPCPSGHLEINTSAPAPVVNVSWTSSLPQCPHVMLPTLIPHLSQVYAAIDSSGSGGS